MSTKVDPDDFIIVPNNTHGEVVTSREAVRYWDCRKISDFEYQVTNNSGAPNITDNIHFFPHHLRFQSWIQASFLPRWLTAVGCMQCSWCQTKGPTIAKESLEAQEAQGAQARQEAQTEAEETRETQAGVGAGQETECWLIITFFDHIFE